MLSVGWTPLNEDRLPKRAARSGYSWETDLSSPPRIYTTEKRAAAQSPIKEAAEVFIKG
jgi:hypothetical protein